MKGILPIYVLVRKLVDHENLVTSKWYKEEYQQCEVVEVHGDVDFNAGDRILIGNKITFDPAEKLGDGLFFIYAEDVYGIMDEDKITPRRDFVYIKANKDRKKVLKHGDLELYNDTSYNPLDDKNIVQDGVILSICKEAKHDYFGHDLKIEAKLGDKVYNQHFLTDQDNERDFNGEKYYEIRYENLYCKIEDDHIVMLNDWNFITPVVAEQEVSESGIILDFKQKNQIRVGVVNHTCQSLLDRGINVGDKIFFKYGREYKIDVEGTVYYRIETNDILYKIE